MPYIKPEIREQYDPILEEIIINLRTETDENLAGVLNYCISKMVYTIAMDDMSYHRINFLMGMLECSKEEFYRRVAIPYENEKIVQNGDVIPGLPGL